MECPGCGSKSVRLSRFRVVDLPRLLRLEYPVRCRECRERIYVRTSEAKQIHQIRTRKRQA